MIQFELEPQDEALIILLLIASFYHTFGLFVVSAVSGRSVRLNYTVKSLEDRNRSVVFNAAEDSDRLLPPNIRFGSWRSC